VFLNNFFNQPSLLNLLQIILDVLPIAVFPALVAAKTASEQRVHVP
jgi:hypothetical protein